MDGQDSEEIQELIRRIGLGDRASFAAFYDRYWGLIYATALKVLTDPAEAEDTAQETFFLLWEKAPMYDPSRGKPLTWATTVARNKAIDRFRALQRRSRLHEKAEEESLADHDWRQHRGTEAGVEQSEEGQALRRAVMKLSRDQREAIEMAYFGGMTQQEIARRLQEPIGTIKARIRRGMMRLKKLVTSVA